MAAGPFVKRNYVSHVHSSFPGLLKTIFRTLGLPPLNLYDAAASDLADCFTTSPDFTPYKVVPIDERLFEPAQARDPLDPKPGPRMDDPKAVREALLTDILRHQAATGFGLDHHFAAVRTVPSATPPSWTMRSARSSTLSTAFLFILSNNS